MFASQDEVRRNRHLLRWSSLAVAGLLALGGAFYALAYPALFPPPVGEPAVELDPAEGKVWLDSQVVIELRGSFTEKQVLDQLEVRPKLRLTVDDIHIEQKAGLPWHESMPWATTRVTINPERSALFDPDTEYEIKVRDQEVVFETITIPEVVSAIVEGDPGGDRVDVTTTSGITLGFNEEIVWNNEYATIDPPAAFRSETSTDTRGRTVVRLLPATRWENSRSYELTVHPGIRDIHGHAGGDTFALEFSTWPPPTILGAIPEGVTQPVDAPLRVQFERAPDHAAAEASLAVSPPIAGAFEWESETVMLWRPSAPLPYSTEYSASVGGLDPGGDTFVPHAWTFRTQDPPISLDVQGGTVSPTILVAVPGGGLGSYAYQWNDGVTTGHKALVVVPHGETRTVEVTVTSGDQVAVRQVQVSGPAAPRDHVPVGCPEGWDLVAVSICYRQEELPGPVRTFLARIDIRDPDLEVTSALAADYLGARRTVSEASAARGSLLAVNGDFFQPVSIGSVPVGPLIADGSIVQLDRRFDAAFTILRDGRSWASSAGDSYFVVGGQAGDIAVRHVNTAPPEGEIAVFNSHRGTSLTLPFEACYASFVPTPGGLSALNYACGPITRVPLPNDRVVIVARGTAAPWLEASLASPLGIFDPQGLFAADLLVGGSHALLRDGQALPLGGAHLAAGPRTAIGVDAAGFLYLVVVDGRSAASAGMTLHELQGYLQGIGLTQAINLDGGGSTAMVLFGGVRNQPSDGKERPVAGVIEVSRPVGDCGHALVRCR